MTSREVMLEGGSPWGFRMHGGVDQQQPLKVSRVNPGSKAAFKGIREGDIITSINAKSTKDITNSEAHALLRHAGNTLTLGLNEDLTNSPKRRQYRYAQQESQSDIVKRSSTSSITLNKFDTSEIYDTESISLNEDAPRSNGITSQRSTLSSNCSSAPSTPSDTRANNTDANCIQNVDLSILTACDAMADISNNISRSRRRRNRRKSKRNGNTVDGSSITSETLLISEEIGIDSNETAIDTLKDIKINTVQSPNINEANVTNVINKQSEENEATISENVTVKTATDRLLQEEANYRVESPTPPAKKASPPKNGAKKSPVKSRSLDDDEIKITELSEVSETEEKAETTGAIVAEVESESDREEAKNLQTTNEHSNKTDRAETKTMSSDDEENLKMTPTRVTDDKSIDEKKPNAETPKVKKAKTRAELVQYFMPIYQNPRYLDAISEESSDLSDKEQIETRKRTVTQTKAKHGKRFGPIRVAEQPQLVDARIIDNVNVAETICTVATTESRSAGAELVYIDDSGADTETDDYADIDDDEFNECLAANGIRPDRSHAGTYSDAEPTSKETDVDTRSIPLTQLTPPPTPDHETTRKHECTRLIGDMHEFIATVETYVSQKKQKQLQATLLDPRYLCLPKELKEKINCAVRCDDNNRDRVVEAAVYSNVVTPTPSRSPSAGSDSGSSRATSLCTTKYNPSSSVGDMKSIDVNADNPITLREICVNKLISLPFGADILEELAEVSRNLQQLTQITGNSNVQTQPSPAFIVKEPPAEINNNSLKFASDSQYSDSHHWLGPHEEKANPQLDRANKIKNLKEAFLNDTNCQDSSTFENATGKNRLLAIIKSSSLDDEYKTDSSEDHAPPVPPKPKFHRSLGALPTAQPTIEGNEARLKAQNLSEWLKLARNKSVSDSNFQTATSKSNSHRETNSMYCILEDEQKQSRRASLPPNLYQKQMDDILRKEMEVKEEIKRLETERLRLSSERMVKPSDDRCVESEITKRTSTTSCDVRQIPIRMESDGNAAIECGDAAKEITIPITLDEGFQIKTVENEISNRTTNVASRVKQIPITLLDDECNKTEAIADDGNKPKERVAPIAELQISPPIDHNVRIVPMKIESESSDKIIPIEIENDVSVAKLQVTQRDVDSYKTEKRESFEERFKRFFDHKMQEHHKPSPILLLDHNNNNNEELNVRIRNVKSEDDTNINNNSIGKNQTNERIIPIKIDNLESESQKQTGAVKTETIIPITLTNVNSDINRKENIIPITVEANENALKPNDGKERGEEKTTRETIIPIQLEAKGDVKERTIPIEVEKDKRFEPNDYIISKQGDIAIFNEEFKTKRSFLSNLPPPTEIFRQQMFEEYKNRMAERMERKHQKIIKISSRPEDNNCTAATATNVANNATLLDIENEFIDKAKRRMDKYGIKLDGSPAKEGSSERSDADENGKADVVIVEGDGVLRDRKKLPQHLREFVDITRNADEDAVDGIWSPGQQSSSTFKSESLTRSKESNVLDDDPIPPVWTPKSAHSSPKADRKEFKPVNFKSPILGRRNRVASEGSAESVETSWKLPASHGEGATSNKGIPNSYSAPASGFVDINAISRLPKAQNPTITLLQRAREGQLPRGAYYLDKNEQMKSGDRSNDKQVYDIKLDYTSESEGERQSKRMSDSGKSDGPNKGVPFVLRSDVRDANQSRWYKKMYDTIHKQKDDEEFVTVRYKQRRGRYPYTSGYFSEPDPATYDSDASDLKFSTLDQRRLPSNGNVKGKENGFAYSSATMPRNSTTTVKYTIPPSDAAKHAQDVYRNQPGRIENYVPGHSSISEKEAKEWWDEVMDIFDGHLEQQKHVPQPRSFINQALKESGYESDSTLVFRRRNDTAQQQLSPSEQKEAYKTIQKGGDVPLQGLRKPAPERPKEPDGPISPAIGHQLVRNPPIPESPRKYVENEVTIHYRTPIRQEIKEAIGEDELARRQAEAMKKIYQEERRRKYLQELQDVNSRRHTDNFIPSQKSPIPLNRYDDVVDSFSPKVKPRPRSPEPRLVARALYNFVGQSARELTFRKGDIIYIKRQVDKNWYEGEHNAMIGLFPANYVEIIPYDGVKTTPRKSHEGQARAKYNFIAQTHLELSLAKGELVVITRKVDDNWYEGKIGGRKGIFPASYVEVLIDPIDPPPSSTKPVASPASHSLLLNGSAGGKESMGTHSYTPSFPHQPLTSSYHRAKPVQVTGSGTYGTLTRKSPIDQTLHIDTQSEPVPYRALYKYRPQNDDELELLEGDTVFVLEKCDDGWFVGSSERTGAFGTFPGNYVERI